MKPIEPTKIKKNYYKQGQLQKLELEEVIVKIKKKKQ